MLTRTKVLDLTIAALLILTLAPGPATAGAPVRGPALAAGPTTRAVDSLNRVGDSGAYFTDFSVPSVSSVVQDSLTPLSTGATTRVSVASDGSQGNGNSGYWPSSISAGGRYVAFTSGASNLVSGDTNGLADIFVHDRQTTGTTRVSVASDGGQGNNTSQYPSISADGRYVAFRSSASNLVSGDTNGYRDIFVHDRQTGETTRISVASDGTQGNGSSRYSSISGDGRYVAFHSDASNLVGGDTNGKGDVFVHNRQTGETSRVSVASNGGQGNSDSEYPSISTNGRYVAFYSYASNLVGGDTNGTFDVFVHDRQMGETTRVSLASDGGQGNNASFSHSISADGRYVAFGSYASNLVGGDTNDMGDVFVHDRETGETSRVSVTSEGTQGNNDSYSSFISADGRYVAFYSSASNLISGDTNGKGDVFVHNRETGEMTRISVASDGGQGNSTSFSHSISADGRYVAFGSYASNLVSGDTNGKADIFVHDRGASGPYAISGRVSDAVGNPIADVTISAGSGGSATTDGSGTYTLTNLITGTYTLTPNKSGWTFTPVTHAVSVPPSATGQDFTGSSSGPPLGKPPIVFVHGWNGLPPWGSCERPDPDRDGYFESVDEYLENVGYYVGYARLETSPCYTPPLVENVARLQHAIALAKAATGQDKVILIAHSMGGLVSRAYIEGPEYTGDVEALFTFGSPHQGVPADVLTFFANGLSLGVYCRDYQPAACDLSVLGMKLFNWDHPDRAAGVTYHVISGDAPFSPRSVFAKVTHFFLPGGNDGVVQTDSGIGLGGLVDRWTTDEVHGADSGPRSYFIRDAGPSASYMQCLKPVLVDKTTSTCGSFGLLQVTEATTPTLAERTPFEYGTLLAGQTNTHTSSLPGGSTLFAAHYQTGTLAVTLVDPNDQVIDPAYAASYPDSVTYAADGTVATYDFPDAIAGDWDMVLKATDVPTAGSDYTTFTVFDSALKLTAETDHNWYTSGATATITAALSDSPVSAMITATILYADGVSETLSLSSQGAGQYQGAFVVPDAPGYGEVRLVATGSTATSVPFERGLNLVFQVAPDSVALTGAYSDTPLPRAPGSAFYEALSVTVGINSIVSGTVGLSAELVDADDNFVAHSFTLEDIITGTGVLALRFDGDEICASGLNGPYTLTNLLLTDQRGATLAVLEAEDVYITATYNYRSFGTGNIYLPLVLRNY